MSAGSCCWSLQAASLAALWVLTGSPLPAAQPEPSYVSDEARDDALARALIWTAPARPVGQADLGANPTGPGSFPFEDPAECRFRPSARDAGTTPKFDCTFANGDVLKVKYQGPEVFTEVAASRLLEALGAGADRMYLVRKLRCFGCPEDPHVVLRCISSPFDTVRDKCGELYGEAGPNGELKLKLDYSSYTDFGPVAIERRAEGKVIRTPKAEGWGFEELDRRQSNRTPSTRAERDALRLLAVLLNDWDNRPDNQRLLCLPGGSRGKERCDRPFAYIQDLGATFGRVGGDSKADRKLDLEGWRAVPIWKDAASCRVEIESPRLHGASFGEAVISESGRRFLADRLSPLSEAQVRRLFEGARFADFEDASAASRDAGQWVAAFQEKVRQIAERPACPTP